MDAPTSYELTLSLSATGTLSGLGTINDYALAQIYNGPFLIAEARVVLSEPPIVNYLELGMIPAGEYTAYLEVRTFTAPFPPTEAAHSSFASLQIEYGTDGDFNHDEAVDAADYVMWRHGAAARAGLRRLDSEFRQRWWWRRLGGSAPRTHRPACPNQQRCC